MYGNRPRRWLFPLLSGALLCFALKHLQECEQCLTTCSHLTHTKKKVKHNKNKNPVWFPGATGTQQLSRVQTCRHTPGFHPNYDLTPSSRVVAGRTPLHAGPSGEIPQLPSSFTRGCCRLPNRLQGSGSGKYPGSWSKETLLWHPSGRFRTRLGKWPKSIARCRENYDRHTFPLRIDVCNDCVFAANKWRPREPWVSWQCAALQIKHTT